MSDAQFTLRFKAGTGDFTDAEMSELSEFTRKTPDEIREAIDNDEWLFERVDAFNCTFFVPYIEMALPKSLRYFIDDHEASAEQVIARLKQQDDFSSVESIDEARCEQIAKFAEKFARTLKTRRRKQITDCMSGGLSSTVEEFLSGIKSIRAGAALGSVDIDISSDLASPDDLIESSEADYSAFDTSLIASGNGRVCIATSEDDEAVPQLEIWLTLQASKESITIVGWELISTSEHS